jgi:hypothetical protein
MDPTQYKHLLQYINRGTIPSYFTPAEVTKLKGQSQHFLVNHSILFKKNRQEPQNPLRVVKTVEKPPLLKTLHQDIHSGHFGINGTYSRAAERYYWHGMYKDVQAFVQSCDSCQRRGKIARNEELCPIEVTQAFDRVGLDFVGPLPLTKQGNRYILVATEYLTKWPEAKAVPRATAQEVVTFLIDNIVSRHGVPKKILTDQGTHFTNEMVKQLCVDLNIHKTQSTAYHPQTNGLTERYNKTLCESLAKTCYQHKKEWDQLIPAALFAYRTVKHSTTHHSPYFSLYGRLPKLPLEWNLPTHQLNPNPNPRDFNHLVNRRVQTLVPLILRTHEQVRKNIKSAQVQQKKYYDQKVKKQLTLLIGDQVLLYKSEAAMSHSDKLEPKFTGPYYIHERHPNGVYSLRTLPGQVLKKRIHAARLKKYYTPVVEI